MGRTVEFPLETGGTVLVQVDEAAPSGTVMRGMSVEDKLEQADRTFEAALQPIAAVAQSVLAKLSHLATAPDEITVDFGIELTGHLGAVLASTDVGAQLHVSLVWKARASSSVGS